MTEYHPKRVRNHRRAHRGRRRALGLGAAAMLAGLVVIPLLWNGMSHVTGLQTIGWQEAAMIEATLVIVGLMLSLPRHAFRHGSD
jgi:hypothetical protein